jgi:hypothetical protein
LPTNLPRPLVKPKRSIFSVVLNVFMLGSALILTVMVLIQEERYAQGQPGYFADTFDQMIEPATSEITGEPQIIPPPD